MNSKLNFIGVDLGGESGRVMVGSFDGTKILLDQKHRFPTGGLRHRQSLRWDVAAFWKEIEIGLKCVASDRIDVCSIGVDTWGVDYVLLDDQDELLGLPFHYRDSRTVGTLKEINQTLSRSEIFATTGIQFMEINTLCQLFAASRCGTLDDAACLLTIPDFFHWRMSGFKGVEFTNATTTQCFDSSQRTWAKPMLKSIGIPTDMFPAIVEPGTKIGTLTDSVAASTGLGKVSVVTPATHDTGSAVAAVPVDARRYENRWAYISSGTWSLVGIETKQPILSKPALAANVTNEGGVDGTWRVLKNVMGLWLVQQTKLAFSKRNFIRTYDEITQLAAGETNECYIDPDDPSFLNPADMEVAIGDFIDRTGQPALRDENHLMRCVFESLALRYHEVLVELKKLSGISIDVLHIVGGGSQNALLNQFIANATGVSVVAGPAEATAIGNVMVQCKAAKGVGSLEEMREVIRNSCDLECFEPQETSLWKQKLERFASLQICR